MNTLETKNAVIKSATITNDDHGLLSAWLTLDYGGSGQGFGGLALYLPKSFTHHTLNSIAGHFIWRCMEIAGVDKWEQLPGKTIRVRASHGGVEAIGHIINDDWFSPRADFAGVERERSFRVPADLNSDTADLVRQFAAALASKLHAAEKKYGYSNGWMQRDWMDECRAKLREHIDKGDPRDVAAYCAFLWHHGERTTDGTKGQP